MPLFKLPEKKPQSKLEEFRDGALGLVVLIGLGFIGWHWLSSGDEPPTAEAVAPPAPSPQDLAEQARVDEAKRAAAQAAADEAARKEAAERAVAEAAEAEKRATEAAYGFHCLSGWDGSHRGFMDAVKQRLNDPDSFEHDETTTWRVREDGQNAILMLFRAKNGFGGVMRGKATGTFDNKSCTATVIDIQ